MTRPRLTAATMDPGLRAFNAKLYIDTRIDSLMLANWIRSNQEWLRAYIRDCERMDEAEAYAWLRIEFKKRMAALRNSQSVSTPTIPASGPAHVSESAGDLHEYFYQLARERLL